MLWAFGPNVGREKESEWTGCNKSHGKKLQLFRETVTQYNKMEFIRNFPANAFQKPDSLWE